MKEIMGYSRCEEWCYERQERGMCPILEPREAIPKEKASLLRPEDSGQSYG